MRTVVLMLGVAAMGTACTPYSPDLGAAPFLCGPSEPRCPEGYSCMAQGDAGAEVCSNGTLPVDAAVSCADDSAREPNDKLENATATPVDTMKTYALSGLSVCPAGDKDTYAINIRSAGENVEIVAELDRSGSILDGAILNAGGVPIARSSPRGTPVTAIRAYAPNLPVGMYYAQIFDADRGTNNYSLTITVTGP